MGTGGRDEPGRENHEDPLRQLLVSRGWIELAHAIQEGTVYGVRVKRAPGAAGSRPFRLSPSEFTIAQRFACGLSSKEIGAELCLADSTTRGALLRACKKLHVKGALLPLFWHTLQSVEPVWQATASGGGHLRYELDVGSLAPRSLTASERTLVLQVLLGHSNPEIARARSVSPQTVANQLHTAFGKLKVSSRGELAASLLRADRAPTERCRVPLSLDLPLYGQAHRRRRFLRGGGIVELAHERLIERAQDGRHRNTVLRWLSAATQRWRGGGSALASKHALTPRYSTNSAFTGVTSSG